MTDRRDALRALLLSHVPADTLEQTYRDRMVELTHATGSLGREHVAPGHFTASAFVLSPDEDSLLLILHSKLKMWLQPGGHIDAEDVDVVAAARREVAEETGLGDDDLEIVAGVGPLLDLDIHPIPANPRKGEGPHKHFDVRVLLRATTLQITAGSDAQDARWVRLAEVEDAGTDDSVRRAVRKLIARQTAVTES
jgi:8-oxo-dGTP pyrophosphatase MutT (NUDIX family)